MVARSPSPLDFYSKVKDIPASILSDARQMVIVVDSEHDEVGGFQPDRAIHLGDGLTLAVRYKKGDLHLCYFSDNAPVMIHLPDSAVFELDRQLSARIPSLKAKPV